MTAPTSWTPVDLAALDDCAWETLKSSSFVVVACLHNGRDMHQYSGPVVLAIYSRLLNLQPALAEKLLPSMFRVTYVRSTNAYVVSYPTVLSGMLYYSTQNGFDANGEDDNLITLSNPMDYTATTQERGKRDITFGFAQLPPGALDSEADIATTVKNALLSVGLSLNHLQRRLDKYGLATGEFIMRFTMLPCFDSSNLRVSSAAWRRARLPLTRPSTSYSPKNSLPRSTCARNACTVAASAPPQSSAPPTTGRPTMPMPSRAS